MIDLRSSENEPASVDRTSGPGTADYRTPFQSFKDKLNLGRIRMGGDITRRQPQRVPTHGRFYDTAPDVLGIRTGISNVYMIGSPGSSHWVLVDAGARGSAGTIISAAENRFGAHIPPSAIVLTHGHFDHVGSLSKLLDHWDVPIYAHMLELPYLTGRSNYPPPDPSVDNGLMARLSFLYPRKPIDLGHRVRPLPSDGRVSQLPGWRWLHTPGHTPGHISLFRDNDRILIAGDAFVTTHAESLFANMMRTPEVSGPPKYFTPNWHDARQSVQMLAQLEPEVAATGHGIPLNGEVMREELQNLASNFEFLAVPDRGRYIRESAQADEHGVISVPPPPPQFGRSSFLILAGMGAGFALAMQLVPRRKPHWRDLF